MKTITTLTLRALLALGLAVTATACMAEEDDLGTDTAELPVYGYYTTFYTDASHTTMVGWERLNCAGQYKRGGTATEFEQTAEIQCSRPPRGDL
jgi:hypothetical protein